MLDHRKFPTIVFASLIMAANPLFQGDVRAAAENAEKGEEGSQTDMSTNPALDAAVTKILSAHFEKSGPGAAVLVSQNGVVKVKKCYGMSNAAAQKLITVNSVFDLASMSKQFTAAAILLLVSDGKFALDDPITKILPDFKVPVKGRSVTVGDLVYHLSGLANYTGDQWEGTDEEFKNLTPSSHLSWINGTKAQKEPGVEWDYNNSNYALLALIIERASKMSYAEFLKTRLFKPAGMNNTYVHDKLDLHTQIPDLVEGYKVKDGVVSKASEWTKITGDGNILTTIDDMARWDSALRNNKIFTPEQRKLAWSSGKFDSGALIDNEGDGYGFGLNTDLKLGMVWHKGSWTGTSTCIRMYVKTGVTIVVLSNDENADACGIVNEIDQANDDAG